MLLFVWELLQACERTLEVISITIDTVNSDLENVGVLLRALASPIR